MSRQLDAPVGQWTCRIGENGEIEALERAGLSFTPSIRLVTDGISPKDTQGQMHDLRLTRARGNESALIGIEGTQQEPIIHTRLDGGYELRTRLHFTEDWVEMTLDILYRGNEPSRLRYVSWTVHGLSPDRHGDAVLFGPGTMPVMDEPIALRRPIAQYQSDNLISHIATGMAPHNSSGIMGAYDTKREIAEATWFLSEYFPCGTSSMTHAKGRLTRNSEVHCPRMMLPGDTLSVGAFFYGIFPGSREHATSRVARSLQCMGWDKPADEEKLRDLCVMEIFVGEKMNRVLFESYAEVIEKLPRIKAMGWNTLEIMPAMPFPSYTVFDFMDAKATYNDDGNLHTLIDKAHEMGMRVLFDMVLHGPREVNDAPHVRMPRSPLLDAPDDWFIFTEHGTHAHTYTRSFDLSSPGYQKYIIDAMLYYLSEWHVDGFRLDAQNWNSFPNWNGASGREPYENLLSGYRMMDRIRAEVNARYPHAVYYTEARAPGAAHGHEYRYNYDYHWLYPALCEVVDIRRMANLTYNYGSANTLSWPDAALWCAENAAISPKGMAIVQQVDSHDSCEWGGFVGGQYNREAFGDEAYEVLFAVAAFLGGAMMTLYGASWGHEEYVGKVLALRREEEVFARGRCDILGLTADDPKVATILWTCEDTLGAFVGNLTKNEKTCTLTLDSDHARDMTIIDALTDKSYGAFSKEALINGVELTLLPFGKHVFIGR